MYRAALRGGGRGATPALGDLPPIYRAVVGGGSESKVSC
jgi:hypothetical protein